ncbi:MAG: HlyC/CorC family transporter [Lachnospiraceae bacterium]|jgi:putative hemolysin|nr:HlyC/CorC family transporter [Lachnospiraceae bacterium]
MDDGGASACSMILFLVMLFVEAVLVGFNKAVSLMNEKEIERRAEEDKDKKSVLLCRIIERATVYVNSIQMITTLIELVMGYFFLPRWSASLRAGLAKLPFLQEVNDRMLGWAALLLAAFLLMYVLLTFGILLPKKIAQKYPDAWAYCFIRHIQFLRTALYPLTKIVAASANGLLWIFGLRNTDEQADVTEAEIISMVNEGHELGVLEAGEVEMITNIFEFGDKEASDIMTHRNNIMALDSTTPFKEALNFMLKESNSRYPVYEENLDHVIGVLYLKDAMRIHTSDEELNQPIGMVEGLFREAVFVPETKNIDDLFRSMQSGKNQMVIVMDEYGQTSGLVTMEDILEEIVGNIMDEYDPEENHIEEKGENEYVIEGMTKLEDLEERFDISFGETEFETLNGYLISKLDRIPDEDENSEVEIDGYTFKIAIVEKNVIQSVLVKKLEKEEQPESGHEDGTPENK